MANSLLVIEAMPSIALMSVGIFAYKLTIRERPKKENNVSYKLRDYQVDLVEAGLRGFKKGKPFILMAAAGSGKSIVIAEITKQLGEPMLVLAPTKEIVEQDYEKMLATGVEDVKLYSASVGQKEIGNITIATIASIYKKPKLFAHFKHIIIDEVHLVGPKNIDGMYMKFFRDIGTSRICGLTATPYRMETKFVRSKDGGMVYTGTTQMLNRITKHTPFKSIECKVEMEKLIENGYLCKTKYHTYKTDLTSLKVNTTGRDYTEDSLEEWGSRRIDRLVAVANDIDSKHQRVLVFLPSIKSAERLQEKLQGVNIKSEVITGATNKKTRESVTEAFKGGDVRWVLNVGVYTTGFDMPVLDCVVLLRPTFSVPLFVQIAGRCQRIDPGNPDKVAHFYDLTNTVEKFGRPEHIHIVKEDGFKDMLVGEQGRIDNQVLYEFDAGKKFKKVKPKQQKLVPKEITLDYLLELV